MKIFISWSGNHSLAVATALREWLPYIFNGIDLFVSSEDIRKGKRWPAEVSKELGATNFGIVCLTRDNLEAPWLLFEAGALSKSVAEASVYTLLTGGLRIGDVEGPLSHFQHTIFEKEDFFKLVRSINDAHGQGKQDEARLRRIFDKWWEELETVVSKAIKTGSKPEKTRTADEMLHDILEITSQIARKMPESRESQFKGLYGSGDEPFGKTLWDKFLNRFGAVSPLCKSAFQEAHWIFSEDGEITFVFPSEGSRALVDNDKMHNLVQTIMGEMGMGGATITFAVSPAAAPVKESRPPPRFPRMLTTRGSKA